MKINYLICIGLLLFLALSSVVYANKTADVIETAEKLIEKKQYYSAFKMLHDHDPDHSNVDIFLIKSRLALDYSAQNFMHHSFAFANLRPGQTLEDAKSVAGSVNLFNFRIDRILDRFLEEKPDDPRLNLLKGDLYFDIYRQHRSGWFLSPEEILSLSREGYDMAVDSAEDDCRTLLRMGETRSIQKDYATAERFFLRAVEINEKCGEAWYNLSLLNYTRKQYSDALDPALKALSVYDDPRHRSEASFLIAMIYESLNDPENALKYALKADSISPGELKYMNGVLILYVKEADYVKAREEALRIFGKNLNDYNILRDIISLFVKADSRKEIPDLLKEIENKYPDNSMVQGHVNFARAFYHSEYTGNNRQKLRQLRTAEEHYLKVYTEDHEIFNIIKRELNE